MQKAVQKDRLLFCGIYEVKSFKIMPYLPRFPLPLQPIYFKT